MYLRTFRGRKKENLLFKVIHLIVNKIPFSPPGCFHKGFLNIMRKPLTHTQITEVKLFQAVIKLIIEDTQHYSRFLSLLKK